MIHAETTLLSTRLGDHPDKMPIKLGLNRTAISESSMSLDDFIQSEGEFVALVIELFEKRRSGRSPNLRYERSVRF